MNRFIRKVVLVVIIIAILCIMCVYTYADVDNRGELIPIVDVVKAGVENSAIIYPSYDFSETSLYEKSNQGISHRTIEYVSDDWKSETPEIWEERGLTHDLSQKNEFDNVLYSKISYYDNFYLGNSLSSRLNDIRGVNNGELEKVEVVNLYSDGEDSNESSVQSTEITVRAIYEANISNNGDKSRERGKWVDFNVITRAQNTKNGSVKHSIVEAIRPVDYDDKSTLSLSNFKVIYNEIEYLGSDKYIYDDTPISERNINVTNIDIYGSGEEYAAIYDIAAPTVRHQQSRVVSNDYRVAIKESFSTMLSRNIGLDRRAYWKIEFGVPEEISRYLKDGDVWFTVSTAHTDFCQIYVNDSVEGKETITVIRSIPTNFGFEGIERYSTISSNIFKNTDIDLKDYTGVGDYVGLESRNFVPFNRYWNEFRVYDYTDVGYRFMDPEDNRLDRGERRGWISIRDGGRIATRSTFNRQIGYEQIPKYGLYGAINDGVGLSEIYDPDRTYGGRYNSTGSGDFGLGGKRDQDILPDAYTISDDTAIHLDFIVDLIFFQPVAKKADAVMYTFEDENGNSVKSDGTVVSASNKEYYTNMSMTQNLINNKYYWDVNWIVQCPIWGSSIIGVDSIENPHIPGFYESNYSEIKPGRTHESQSSLGVSVHNVGLPTQTVTNPMLMYIENIAEMYVDSNRANLMSTDTIKSGSNINYFYESSKIDSVLYIIKVLRRPPVVVVDTSTETLYQNQISRSILNQNLGVAASELTEYGPTWSPAWGSHGCEDPDCDGICEFSYMDDDEYRFSYWARPGNYLSSILAAHNTAASVANGLYVKHANNMTGIRTYDIYDWNPIRIIPDLSFVVWRGSSKPTIAEYKYINGRPGYAGTNIPTNHVLRDIANGFGLSYGKIPDNFAKGSDYIETNPFNISRNGDRSNINNSLGVAIDDVEVTAICEIDCGDINDEHTHTGTILTPSHTYNAEIGVKVFSKASTDKVDNASESGPLAALPNAIMSGKAINNIKGSSQAINGLSAFEFFPYLNMTYETLNSTTPLNVFTLSRYISKITPNNYIEYGYVPGAEYAGNESIALVSQLFSTHATAKAQGWYKNNNVLPGGAVYELRNNSNRANLPSIGIATYQWYVVDRDALSSPGNTNSLDRASIQSKHSSMMQSLINNIKSTDNGLRMYIVGQSSYNGNSLKGINLWSDTLYSNGGEVNPYISNTVTVGGRNIKIQNDKKYYLPYEQTKLEIFHPETGVKDPTVAQITKMTDYVIKSDTDGNIYLLKNGIQEFAFTKTATNSQILGAMNNEWQTMNLKTKLVSNYLNSIIRNKGVSNTGSTWYNEAFDGIGIIKMESAFSIGINEEVPISKITVIDPQLEPPQKDKSDIYKNYYKFGWCIKKGVRIDFTFDGKNYTMGNADNTLRLRSREIYLPNASVTDLGF